MIQSVARENRAWCVQPAAPLGREITESAMLWLPRVCLGKAPPVSTPAGGREEIVGPQLLLGTLGREEGPGPG